MIPAEPSPGSSSAPQVWAPLTALSLFCTLLLLGGTALAQRLRFDRMLIARGQWWRLLTDNFVHLGAWHLFLNLLSLVLLAMLCPERLSWLEWLRRMLVIGIGMSLGLYFFSPNVVTYVGLSGAIYGLFALGLGRQILQHDKIAVACGLFLAARIAWELVIGAPASEETLVGGRIVGESHLYGVISALAYGAVALIISKRTRTQPELGGI